MCPGECQNGSTLGSEEGQLAGAIAGGESPSAGSSTSGAEACATEDGTSVSQTDPAESTVLSPSSGGLVADPGESGVAHSTEGDPA